MTDRYITTILEGFDYKPQERDIHTSIIGMEPRRPHTRRIYLYWIPTRATTEEEISTENDYDQE